MAGNALMTSLVLRVSMASGNRLWSGDPYARLPLSYIKKKNTLIAQKNNLIIMRSASSYYIVIHSIQKYVT